MDELSGAEQHILDQREEVENHLRTLNARLAELADEHSIEADEVLRRLQSGAIEEEKTDPRPIEYVLESAEATTHYRLSVYLPVTYPASGPNVATAELANVVRDLLPQTNEQAGFKMGFKTDHDVTRYNLIFRRRDEFDALSAQTLVAELIRRTFRERAFSLAPLGAHLSLTEMEASYEKPMADPTEHAVYRTLRVELEDAGIDYVMVIGQDAGRRPKKGVQRQAYILAELGDQERSTRDMIESLIGRSRQAGIRTDSERAAYYNIISTMATRGVLVKREEKYSVSPAYLQARGEGRIG